MNLELNTAPFDTASEPIDANGNYRPVSFWQETIGIAPDDPLTENTSCDVAIIGGGFTGLSCAIALKQAAPSLDVVLLERAVVGHGASGRNGGFVMPLIGWDLTDAVRKLGEQCAAEAYRLMYQAVEHLVSQVRTEGIDCDLEQTGYLLLATCPARLARLRHEAELGSRLGFEWEYLEKEALNGHIRSDAFLAGVYDPRPVIVNPAKLARGLLDLAKRLGVRVFEQTSLVELVDGDPVTARTPLATVQADQVVLAVNGYCAALGFMSARVQPVHTYIVLTEPLSDRDLDAIGWRQRRTSLETARNFIHYFRLTADNRVLFGGEDATVYYDGTFRDVDEAVFRRLEARFRRYFPSLNHVGFTHRWGGVLGVTLDMFPSFGVGGEHGTIFHATGYSGHGVALSNYAGKLLAPHMLARAGLGEQPDPAGQPFFWGRNPIPLPPDPLRYLGLQAYRTLLHAQDRWQGA